MSCPDWRRLVTERDAQGGDAGAEAAWGSACEHLDACPRCREAALDADPTLVFRRLAGPVATAADVSAMKLGVAAMIRASRVASPAAALAFESRPARPFRLGSGRQGRGWQVARSLARPAAAAALLAGLVLQAPIASRAPPGARGRAGRGGLPRRPGAPRRRRGCRDRADRGGLDLPDARVYEVAAEDLQVAMIVDRAWTCEPQPCRGRPRPASRQGGPTARSNTLGSRPVP